MTGQIRCHYDVLGVERDADAAIVKKAHRKLALKHHPDKTVSLDEQQREESAAEFKLIQAAYECLSDPVERKWYDEHRDMILRGGMHGSDAADGESSFVYDVTPFHFSGCYDGYDDNNPDNFYSVYAECFESIYNGEKDGYISEGNIDLDDMHNAHLSEVSFGNSQSKWEEVSAFYNSWEAFTTSLNFAWVDIYHLNDLREAPNRRIRRLMEDDNRKKRKAAKKERVEEVIALVRFVKKRDPRVRAQREEQLRDQAKKEAKDKKDAEERKKKREIAKQEWRIQQEIAMAEQEATDLDAGRIRLADLDSDDDYDYGGGKGKGRKKKKGKRRGKNNKSYDFDNEDTNEVDASVDVTDGNVAESENDDTDRLEVNEEAGNDSTQILDDADVDDSGSNIPDNDDMGDNDVEYDIMSSEEESESEEEPDSWRCECCRKDFKSAAQFENHTKSKKHKEKWKQYEKKLQKEAKQKAVEDLMNEIDGGN